MRKLNAYQVTELTFEEMIVIDGGGVYEWYLAGIEAGKAVAKAVKRWLL